jgi:acetyltransferase-like isoleucine patch superfamily enzyme
MRGTHRGAERAIRRSLTSVGRNFSFIGRLHVDNAGSLVIGDDVHVRATPVRSHIVVSVGGRMTIGDGVHIGHGAALSCQSEVIIEAGATLGAFVMIMDSDFHVAGANHEVPQPRPVRVGRGARLGHWVIVLPGARIGEGAVVGAGSVVSGVVRAGTVVEGNPARTRRVESMPEAEPGPIA